MAETRRCWTTGLGALLIALCALVTDPQTAYCIENPMDLVTGMEWRDAVGNHGEVDFPYKMWHPDFTGDWDDVYCHHGTNVKFRHLFVQASWPRGGHTAAEAKRFFDVKWDAYRADDSAGTATPAYNCYSYAFGRTGYWVDTDSEVYANDYEESNVEDSDAAQFSGHSVYIYDHVGVEDCWEIIEIRHKDRGSAIFTYEWDMNGPFWDKSLAPHYAGPGKLYKEKPLP